MSETSIFISRATILLSNLKPTAEVLDSKFEVLDLLTGKQFVSQQTVNITININLETIFNINTNIRKYIQNKIISTTFTSFKMIVIKKIKNMNMIKNVFYLLSK